jgi:hypothetical protein
MRPAGSQSKKQRTQLTKHAVAGLSDAMQNMINSVTTALAMTNAALTHK